MNCDYQATISIRKNKNSNNKNRHIYWRHNMVKKLLKDENIFIGYMKS